MTRRSGVADLRPENTTPQGSPAARPTSWQRATVTAIRQETATAKSFRLHLERPVPHLAGQHYSIRLTAPDGYTATRSYSIASPPSADPEIWLTVQRLADGEVSTFLHDVVETGDQFEVRGPIGEWFTWDGTQRALLIGGGSGVVPLMAMLRLARAMARSELLRLVVSVRGPQELLFHDELPGPETTVLHTRHSIAGTPRPAGRLRAEDLPADAAEYPVVYVCGSNGFADHATELLLTAGVHASAIRVERYGP